MSENESRNDRDNKHDSDFRAVRMALAIVAGLVIIYEIYNIVETAAAFAFLGIIMHQYFGWIDQLFSSAIAIPHTIPTIV